MKGISPLVATVLLIAFTIAVGGILSVWLGSFTKTQTTIVESSSDAQVKCALSALVVKEVKYHCSSDPRYANVTVVYETGTEQLSNITISVFSGGNFTSSTGWASGLVQGQTASFTLNIVGMKCPIERVRANSICQGTYPVVAECKSGDPCFKAN